MRAFNAEVFSQRLHVQAYAGPAMLRGVWEHFWEVLPSGALDHLDVFRFHTGTNLVGPWLPGVELWGVVGALLVKRDHLTPAFDSGMDLRIYPHKPLAIRSSAIVSVFEHGPVLLDARAELGVSFGRLEFRTGPRWLYQGELQGFWGPNASLSTRF